MPAVKDIMTKTVITIDATKTVYEAAQLMSAKRIGCLVVTENDVSVGMVTERDFLRRIVAERGSFDQKISAIMSKSLITVDPDMSVRDAARLMATNKIRRLPVVKAERLVGILVASDLVRQAGKQSVGEGVLEALGRLPPGLL
jgi:CBS domain-containing protein